MPNNSSRLVFVAAVLLLLVAGLAGWIAYSGAALAIAGYAVPNAMSWIAAGIFGLVGVFAMRAAHIIDHAPAAIAH